MTIKTISGVAHAAFHARQWVNEMAGDLVCHERRAQDFVHRQKVEFVNEPPEDTYAAIASISRLRNKHRAHAQTVQVSNSMKKALPYSVASRLNHVSRSP